MQSMLRPNQNIPRQICRCWPEYHSGNFANLWVFGPHYRVKELDFKRDAKMDALRFVLERSGCTLPKLLDRLERIEEAARATYADETLEKLPRVKFQEMMARDGCLFLLLAFSILGVESRSTGIELGFPEKHLIFGINCVREEMDLWLNSMFFVGNQIPVMVLEEIMKLRFFRKLKTENQWIQPLDLAKRALYNSLMVEHDQPKPVDLIHCLQSIFLGRKIGSHVIVPILDLDAGGAIEEMPSAAELSNLGIKFEKLDGELGSRGIYYKHSAFNHVLHLPVFSVDRYTELTVKCIEKYEIVQASEGIAPDVTSYLKFLNKLIRTPQDAVLLYSEGLLQGRLEYLPGLLSSFDGVELSEHLCNVRREIRDHPPQHWLKCIKLMIKPIALIAAILTFVLALLQSACSILGHYNK
ncbi:hypothetical protein ACH5RR_032912 [Cinchona calisaya]|uniref:Uncharacterized protein n=1 Tax=Cinchona calisaya TaxID=153742 RepID=A0ABD2YJH1_9GENT